MAVPTLCARGQKKTWLSTLLLIAAGSILTLLHQHMNVAVSVTTQTRDEDGFVLYRPKAYQCGWDMTDFTKGVFPDFDIVRNGSLVNKGNVKGVSTVVVSFNGTPVTINNDDDDILPNPQLGDILIAGMYGICPYSKVKSLGMEHRAVHVNGEPFAEMEDMLGDGSVVVGYQSFEEGRRRWMLGKRHHNGGEGYAENVRVYYVAITLMMFLGRLGEDGGGGGTVVDFLERLTKHRGDVKTSSRREHFLLFIATKCFAHRENAMKNLTRLGKVHRAGRDCIKGEKVRKKYTRFVNVSYDGEDGSTRGVVEFLYLPNKGWWGDNILYYRNYRFILTMENTEKSGYITEKILLAFLAGCVPIYYGTREVFDIFNERAFVYYDVNDPGEAFNRISYLERNETAYQEVLNQPILKDGERTLEEYFSLSDDVGGGKLKGQIRQALGLDEGQTKTQLT